MEQSPAFEFCGKTLGEGHPPYIVAEVGLNHNGDVDLAKKMIQSAADNGADAVKLQTYRAEEMYSRNFQAPDPDHPDREIPLYKFFKRNQLRQRDFEALFYMASESNITLFSSPFDEESLDMLVDCGVPAIKIASGDLTHLSFLRHAAGKGLPIVLSTGMGTMEEIGQALDVIHKEGNEQVILLHCVSSYPAKYEDMNLSCIPNLRKAFNVPIGFSDHTTDNLSATVACMMGAVMIEKHFTISRKLPGPDQAMSLEPEDLKELKNIAQNFHKTIGDGIKKVQPSEVGTKKGARRSLVAKMDIEPGTTIEKEMIAIKRPGTGIPPDQLDSVLGRKTIAKISAENLLQWSDLESG